MQTVAQMYSRVPFPSRSQEGVRRMTQFFSEELRRLNINLEAFRDRPVLDAGCGTGEIASFVASHGPAVVGLDFSEGSLEYAKRTSENVRFLRGSILDAPLRTEQFDFIYSHMVLHHTGDPERGVGELSRVLRPGGLLLFKVFSLLGRGGLVRDKSALWKLYFVRALCEDVEARVRLGERLFYRPGQEEEHGLTRAAYLHDNFGVPIVSHHTFGQALKWLKRAGLTYVASDPPMEFGKMVEGFQGRGALLRRMGLHRLLRNPSPFSRMLSQAALLAMQGVTMFTIVGKK